MSSMADQEAPREGVGPDWRPLLDEELCRLPDKYREAVILCELEGRSRKGVAHQLNLPEGTLSSRLAHARRLLASRLANEYTRQGGSLPPSLLLVWTCLSPLPIYVWSRAPRAGEAMRCSRCRPR